MKTRFIDHKNPSKSKAFLDAVTCAFRAEKTDLFGEATREKRIQATGQVKALFSKYFTEVETKFTATSGDLPVLDGSAFNVTNAGQEFDLGWMDAFKDVAVRDGYDHFQIVTMENPLTVQLVPEGTKLALQKINGTKLNVQLNKYGVGIQWTDEMIRFRDFTALVNTVEDAVEAHQADKADRHYALLTAAAQTTTSYQSTTGNSQKDNDIETLNKAYADLIIANKDKFRGLNANVEVLLYLPITAKGRIERAANSLINDVTGSGSRVQFNIRRIYTLNNNLPAATTGVDFAGLLVLPERKIQKGQLVEPVVFNEQDILSLSYIQTAWQYYGSGVGATSQCRKVNFA